MGINAFISLYQLNMAQGDYNQVLTWISGSLWGSSWKFFYLITPLALIFLGLTIWKSKILDVLDLGDEIAIGLGVKVEKERKILFIYAITLAALATSVAGNIAFLGLLGPQVAKRLVGPVHRRQIPMAAIVSCIIVLFADSISRMSSHQLNSSWNYNCDCRGTVFYLFNAKRIRSVGGQDGSY